MYARMLTDREWCGVQYQRGQVYALMDTLSADWLKRDLCEPVDAPEPIQSQFARRLDHADQSKAALFLPFCGEFGHLVMYYVRYVHFHQARRKIVCCHTRDTVLFPSATEHVTDWNDPIPDTHRVGTMRGKQMDWRHLTRRYPGATVCDGVLSYEQEIECVLRPADPIAFNPVRRGLKCDVLIGTRQRQFAPEKNWPHWSTVAEALIAAGLTVGVIGARDTSYDVPGRLFHTGDYDTDASIEALQNCQVYAGSDSGASHLAATVGTPMVVFREKAHNHRDFIYRMRNVNRRQTVTVENGWDEPTDVTAAIIATLKGSSRP